MTTRNLSGFFLFPIGLLFFALSDATAKHLMVVYTAPLLLWARYAIQFSFLMTVVVPRRGRNVLATSRPWMLLLWGSLQLCGTLLGLCAFRILPLAETTALIFVTPMLVSLLAGPVLGEKIRLRNWLATILGFIGVLLIARPGGDVDGAGVIFALSAALCSSLYQVLTRKLSVSEPPMRQFFYLVLVGLILMSFFLPTFWTDKMPSLTQGLLILVFGFCGGVGHLLLIRAYHESPASRLAPLLYIQMIWAMLLGWLIFDHFPDHLSILGMLVIGGAGTFLVLENRKSRLQAEMPK